MSLDGIVASNGALAGTVSAKGSLEGETTAPVVLRGAAYRPGVIYSDAYAIAVRNGFDGTVEEWLESLKGEKGDKGDPGADGKDGADGVSPVIVINSITGGHRMTVGTANGTTVTDIMDGEKGDPGEPGEKGDAGEKGDKGDPGEAGAAGADGANGQSIIPAMTANVSTTKFGTSRISISDLAFGERMPAVNDTVIGANGYLASISAVTSSYVTVMSLGVCLKGAAGAAGAPGADGEDGYTPVKGTDYFTEADKAAMVDDVLAALPVYDGSVTSV